MRYYRPLTVEQLGGAKPGHIAAFEAAFGNQVLVTEHFDRVAYEKFPVNWVLHNLLTQVGKARFYQHINQERSKAEQDEAESNQRLKSALASAMATYEEAKRKGGNASQGAWLTYLAKAKAAHAEHDAEIEAIRKRHQAERVRAWALAYINDN